MCEIYQGIAAGVSPSTTGPFFAQSDSVSSKKLILNYLLPFNHIQRTIEIPFHRSEEEHKLDVNDKLGNKK